MTEQNNWVLEYWKAIENGEVVSRKVRKVYGDLARRIQNPTCTGRDWRQECEIV